MGILTFMRLLFVGCLHKPILTLWRCPLIFYPPWYMLFFASFWGGAWKVITNRKSTILIYFLHPSSQASQTCTDVSSYYPLLLSQRFPSPQNISSAASAWSCGLTVFFEHRMLVRGPAHGMQGGIGKAQALNLLCHW